MANIFDYIAWRGDLRFDFRPFNELDGLVLCRMSYLPCDGILGEEPMSLPELADALSAHPETEERLIRSDDIRLLKAAAESERFRGIYVCNYVNQIELETQTQFSALCYILEDGRRFVAFRGTDTTLVGWKEDFNMAFICPVPAQLSAVKYLERIAVGTDGALMLGGHSKGGNLAVYAGAFCSDAVQQRIELVYNFDGPGFDQKILDQPGYEAICPRVRTFVPQSSVVGMLLGHEEQYTVVHSQETGLTQHNIYTWDVERESLSYLDTVTQGSRFIDRTLKDWLAGMSVEQRAVLVDTVYEVMQQTGARTVPELKANWFGSTRAMIRAAGALSEDDRRSVMRMLRLLMQSAIGELSGADKETAKA